MPLRHGDNDVRQFLEVLERFGSPALAADVRAHRQPLLTFGVDDILALVSPSVPGLTDGRARYSARSRSPGRPGARTTGTGARQRRPGHVREPARRATTRRRSQNSRPLRPRSIGWPPPRAALAGASSTRRPVRGHRAAPRPRSTISARRSAQRSPARRFPRTCAMICSRSPSSSPCGRWTTWLSSRSPRYRPPPTRRWRSLVSSTLRRPRCPQSGRSNLREPRRATRSISTESRH